MEIKTFNAHKSLTFKRWARKGFSLFRMLKNIVRIGVLAIVYLNSSAAVLVDNIPLSTDTLKISSSVELEEIEIGASRAPGVFSEAARIVTVLTREELKKKPVSSLPDALRQLQGVDIRQRGPEGIQADISIRGGSFDQTAILLNGINITDPQTGHHNLNIPVSFSQIERIEILEGPAARIYGPSAFSGAINIITKAAGKNEVTASYTHGNHNFNLLDAAASFQSGHFSQTISVNHTKSDGYIANTDFKTYNAFLHSTGKFQDGQLDYQLGWSAREFGANSFYTPRYPEQYEKTRTLFTAIKWRSNSLINFSPSIYWRRHHDRFELFRYDKPTWYAGHNYHLTDIFGLNLNSWFISALGKTAAGAEIRSENIWSNVLGDKLETNIRVPGENAFFNRYKSRTSFSIFLEHSYSVKNFHATAGLLAQRSSDLNLEWQIYPGIDISYIIMPDVKIFASAGKSLRLPTFTDLYYNGPTNIGNPELKPEDVTHYETGIKFTPKGINGYMNIYYQKGTNLIDWVKLTGDEKWRTINHTSIGSLGYQLFLKLHLPEYIHPGFFITNVSAGYSSSHLKKENSEYISYYTLDNLKNKVNFSLEHKIIKKLHSGWNAVYQDRNGTYTAFENNVGTEKEFEPFWLLDWKLSYISNNFEINTTITNLLNTSHFDFGNIELPGRWVKAGLTIRIE
jgi:vitamin B12 transporter